MAVVDGERYLVSMLGEEANWVKNVGAAGGQVVLRHGRREEVRLEEVAPDRRVRTEGLPEASASGQGSPGIIVVCLWISRLWKRRSHRVCKPQQRS
jgi:hypothetical protein